MRIPEWCPSRGGVCRTTEGFVDRKFSEHVYVLHKVLYCLKQAPRAWYETLTIHLLESGYKKGTIDRSLFLQRLGNYLTIVQIYVDDIIFASTNPESFKMFELTMKFKLQMSMMGELTFFLGLQVRQRPNGLFINQEKYVQDLSKWFYLDGSKSVKTPMSTLFQLDADLSGKLVDLKNYRANIGSLLYLTTSRLDIVLSTDSHLAAAKRILKYLKGIPNFGLWYLKDSGFELTTVTDFDHAGCKLNKKSTSGACEFLGNKLVSWSSSKQNCVSLSTTEANYVTAIRTRAKPSFEVTPLTFEEMYQYESDNSKVRIGLSDSLIRTIPKSESDFRFPDSAFWLSFVTCVGVNLLLIHLVRFGLPKVRFRLSLFRITFEQLVRYGLCQSLIRTLIKVRFGLCSKSDSAFAQSPMDFDLIRFGFLFNFIKVGYCSNFQMSLFLSEMADQRENPPSPIDEHADNKLFPSDKILPIIENNSFVVLSTSPLSIR
ncbi:hypothetical protein OSB04_020329 [Centaurea solstitialis]|uniref:Reverse transcriptase Ty1/copia-type domain-containing protein n=1 Tax=Centaurea solstitialis TaxID=347529 RepID=A0AA38T5F2_9ASTR|nr:hypothetical protein OSB04_020329 [Centaurea solstitialis]